MAKRPTHSLDPEDVLRGRWRPDSAALCALIRSVNPTGVELPAAERGRRYALKSKLQSVLVLRFGDEVEVSFDPAAGEGFALLRHRPTASTAGHALIAELEDEARSWVQHQIDVGGSSSAADKALPASAPRPSSPRPSSPRQSPPESPPAGGEGAGDLLEQGRRVVLEYDYDGARSLLSQALALSQGGAAAAEALLDLLVEQLGADLDALALVDSLGAAALAEPRVRRHLAIAAARSGDRAAALRFVKGVAEEHVAEVFAALARGALGCGDVVAATRDLAEVRGRDPAHPELRALGESLEQARAASRRPLEERVVGLVAAGRLDEAEAAARDAGLETSKSAEVRSALRILQERARRARAAELLARADEAQRAGDFQGAIGVLRRLLLEQPEEADVGPVTERLAAVEAAEHARAEAAEAQRVVRLLAAVDPVEGMIAYVGATPEVRARVRALSPRTELERLDDTGVADTGARARAAVVAVLALQKAEVVAVQAPEAALAHLEPHQRLLQRVQAAQQLRERGEAARVTRLRAEARQNLERARAVLAPFAFDDPEDRVRPAAANAAALLAQGQALLSDATVRCLDEPDRAAALWLRQQMTDRLDNNRFARQLAEMVQRGEIDRARANLEAYLAQPGPNALAPDGPVATFSRNAVDRIIQRSFDVCVAGEGARKLGEKGLAGAVVTDRALPLSELWGRSYSEHGSIEPSLGGGGIFQVAARGRYVFVIVIDLPGGPLLRNFVTLRTPEPMRLHTWGVSHDRIVMIGETGAVLVLSLPDFRVLSWRRPDPPARRAGGIEPQRVTSIALSAERQTVWLLEGPGKAGRTLRAVDLARMRVVHEEQLQAHAVWLDSITRLADAAVIVVDHPPGTLEIRGHDGRPLPGGHFALELRPGSSAAHPRGGLFVLAREPVTGVFGAMRLVPGVPPGSPQPIEGLAAGDVLTCVTDQPASLVFVLKESLGSEHLLIALALDEGTCTELYRTPVPCRCALVSDNAERRVDLLVLGRGLFQGIRLGREAPSLPVDPDPLPLLDITPALGSSAGTCRGPFHAVVESASRYAASRSWDKVRTALRAVDEARLDDASARHFAHVLGLALLFAGEHEEAHRVLLRGEQRPGGCKLGALLAVAAPLDEDGLAEQDEPSLRDLLRRVAAADVCLAAGDAPGAIAVLADVLVWEARELQSTARLLRAMLKVDSPEPEFQLRTLSAMATYCGLIDEQAPHEREVFVRGRWELGELFKLREEAVAWFEALHDRGLAEEGS